MGVSNSITESEKQWLLKLIEEKFKITLNSHYTCKEFSQVLEKQFNIQISYNTLRRLFGIVDTVNSPSLYTLDKLVSTVGFSSYKHFKTYIQSFDSDFFNGTLFLYRMTKKCEVNKIINGLKYLDFTTNESAYKLKSVVEFAIENEDYDLLESILKIPFDLHVREVCEKLFIGFQEFHIQAEKGNKKLIKFVDEQIPRSEILQRCLLQHFVLEQKLVGYYGNWLLLVKESNIYDFFIFRDILLCQKYFTKNDFNQAKKYFENVLTAAKKHKYELFPILLGRIAAWDFILNNSTKMFDLLYPKVQSNLDYAWFLIFYYRLIWLYKDENYVNEKIILKPIDKFESLVSVYTQEIISKYCIIYFKCSLIKNGQVDIKKLLQCVNLEIFYVGEHKWFRKQYDELLKVKTTANKKSIKTSKLKESSPLTLKQKQKVV